jgi:anti-sigma regulatory factor (Ser/Thr protein kinase)
MFTAAQKKTAVERELSFRRRVYPRWIEQKKMTQKLADEQIAIFEAIRNDYYDAEQNERLI